MNWSTPIRPSTCASASNRRQRFLSEAEVARLLEAMVEIERDGSVPGAFTAAIRLLLLTGVRKNEIARLEWREVDLEDGLIRPPPPRARSGERRSC